MSRLLRILLDVVTVLCLLAVACVVWVLTNGQWHGGHGYFFYAAYGVIEGEIDGHWFTIPNGPALFVLMILPVLQLERYRRWRAKAHARPTGVCGVCGYDLRATPDRCPECGTAAVSKAGPRREGASKSRPSLQHERPNAHKPRI
jgi:hypothetical protein